MKTKDCAITFTIPAEIYNEIGSIASRNKTDPMEIARDYLIGAITNSESTEHDFLSRASWACAVKERDDGKCKKCGSNEAVQAHHKIPVYQGGKNTLENGITLCSICHLEAHRSETYIPKELKRIMVSIKLLPSVIDWLRAQDEPYTKIIEEALMDVYGISPPIVFAEEESKNV